LTVLDIERYAGQGAADYAVILLLWQAGVVLLIDDAGRVYAGQEHVADACPVGKSRR